MRLDHLLSKEKSKGDCCLVMNVLLNIYFLTLPVAMRLGVTPVIHPEHDG